MKVKILSLFTTTIIALSSIGGIGSAYAEDKISVQINGRIVDFPDQEPVVVNGRTMVPIRPIFEALGAKIEWDSETKTAFANGKTPLDIEIKLYFTENSDTIKYYWGSSKVIDEFKMDVNVQNINGRLCVPVRFVANALGYMVTWYEPNKTAYIENPSSLKLSYDTFKDSTAPVMRWPSDISVYIDGHFTYWYYLDSYSEASSQYDQYCELLKNNGWQLTDYSTVDKKYGQYCKFEKSMEKVAINTYDNTVVINVYTPY